MAAVLWHAAITLEQQLYTRALVLLLPAAAAMRPGYGWGWRPSASGCQDMNNYLLRPQCTSPSPTLPLMSSQPDGVAWWLLMPSVSLEYVLLTWWVEKPSYPDSRSSNRRSSILPSSADIISSNRRWCEGRLPAGQWGHVKPWRPGIFSPMGQMDIAWDHLGDSKSSIPTVTELYRVRRKSTSLLGLYIAGNSNESCIFICAAGIFSTVPLSVAHSSKKQLENIGFHVFLPKCCFCASS